MGDADDLLQKGLGWGWGDNYPDFRERLTPAERWSSRSKRQEKRIVEENVEKIAGQLVSLKQKIRALQREESELKDQLSNLMPIMGWTRTSDSEGEYIVEHLALRRKPQLKTDATLKFLSEKYGQEVADLVAEQCSKVFAKHSAIYVRRFASTDQDCPLPFNWGST